MLNPNIISSRLHEERAGAIARIYSLLLRAIDEMEIVLAVPLPGLGEPSTIDDKDNAWKTIDRLFNYYIVVLSEYFLTFNISFC